MAKIRSVRPEFWSSEPIVQLSPWARLLFLGLLNFADDGGTHPASIARLKMEVFPGDSHTAEEMAGFMEELKRPRPGKQPLVIEFTGPDGQPYWHVTGFKEHQKIDRPNIRFPQPPESSQVTGQTVPTDAKHCSNAVATPSERCPNDPVLGIGIGSGKGNIKPGVFRSARKPQLQQGSGGSKSVGAMVGPLILHDSGRGLRPERRIRGKPRPGVFAELTRNDLRDTSRLVRWWEWQAKQARPVIGSAEMDLLNVVAAAERAMEVGVNAVALFASIVGRKCWRLISCEQEDRARVRLREWRYGKPRASPELSGPADSLGSLVTSIASRLSA